jgi:hypothetical protein
MRSPQIESWALSIIDRVESGQPLEDYRVELKSAWIPPEKAARRIAGHANAARGAQILWLIGIDEKNGVTGAEHQELANWYAGVKAQFDGLAPSLIDLNIPVRDKTVVALLFETDRAPFVVKNPYHGKERGEVAELEVPWRENTSIRSATRADLLKLLSPLQALPILEVLKGTLRTKEVIIDGRRKLSWKLGVELYVETSGEDRITIPFHRCEAEFQVPKSLGWTCFSGVHLQPPPSQSLTIEATPDEVFIKGPGKLILKAWLTNESVQANPKSNAHIRISLLPIKAEHAISLELVLFPDTALIGTGEIYKWSLANSS